MALAAGTRLGPYEIESLIGSGGMGEVYRARDTRLHRQVAIKILAAGVSDPQFRERFEREARAVAALSHPNIVGIYDVGTHDDTPYAATELLEAAYAKGRVQILGNDYFAGVQRDGKWIVVEGRARITQATREWQTLRAMKHQLAE